MSDSCIVVASLVDGLVAAAEAAGRGGYVTVTTFRRSAWPPRRDDYPDGRALVVFETSGDGWRERHAQFACELGCWLDGRGSRWTWAFEDEAWSNGTAAECGLLGTGPAGSGDPGKVTS